MSINGVTVLGQRFCECNTETLVLKSVTTLITRGVKNCPNLHVVIFWRPLNGVLCNALGLQYWQNVSHKHQNDHFWLLMLDFMSFPSKSKVFTHFTAYEYSKSHIQSLMIIYFLIVSMTCKSLNVTSNLLFLSKSFGSDSVKLTYRKGCWMNGDIIWSWAQC